MKPGFLPLFRLLTSAPTAPFREGPVAAGARRWVAAHLGRRARVRARRGGLEIAYRGAGPGPALVAAAHLDHPAFRVERLTPGGAVLRLQGRLPPHLLAGTAVEAFAAGARSNRPAALGVLGPRPDGDALWTARWTRPPRRGLRPAFAVLALTPCAVAGGWLSSRSIDDLAGAALALEALRRLARARARTNMTVLLTRAEEVGLVGASDLAAAGALSRDDSYVSIEASRALPGSRPGRGPTVRLGDRATAFDPNLLSLLDAAAARLRRRGTPVQRRRLTGGTCEATAFLAHGLEAAGIALPLVAYHNGWGERAVAPERVRLSDVEGAVRLLVEAARLFPNHPGLRGKVRARLARLHAGSAAALAGPGRGWRQPGSLE